MSFDPAATKRAVKRLTYASSLPSKTKTSFASEADINVIVARFLKTGLLPQSVTPPTYMDTTAVPVGTDALMAVRAAALAFEQLPASLRRELGHDPNNLEAWLRDPDNHPKALKLGLLVNKAPDGSAGPAGGPARGSGGPGAVAPVPEADASKKAVATDETKS